MEPHLSDSNNIFRTQLNEGFLSLLGDVLELIHMYVRTLWIFRTGYHIFNAKLVN